MERLKRETRDLHEAVESRVDVMRPDLSRVDYGLLLFRFLGVYRPLEARLRQVSGLRLLMPDLDLRWKTGLIERDLAVLGCHREAPEAPVAALDSVARAYGALYVMEGATLGGAFISRHVDEVLGLGPENGCAFFTSYGERRGAMWKALGERLNAIEEPEQDAAVAGARETFGIFAHWLGR